MDVIGSNYNAITNIIMNVPVAQRVEVFSPLAIAHSMHMDLAIASDVTGLVNQLTLTEWSTVLSQIGTSFAAQLEPLLAQKNQIEYFFGIHLVYKAGLGFPGIIIPLLSAGTTYLSSKIMTMKQKTSSDNPAAGSMQMMTYMMPVIMGVMTISMPAALGLYWTVGNIFQIFQTLIMNKIFSLKEEKEAGEVIKGGRT